MVLRWQASRIPGGFKEHPKHASRSLMGIPGSLRGVQMSLKCISGGLGDFRMTHMVSGAFQ